MHPQPAHRTGGLTVDLAAHARLRMMSLAKPGLRRTDPVAFADNRTAMNDARTALCIALGVPLDEIDPASGHNMTRAAYERSRESWRWNAAMHGLTADGLTDWYARAHEEMFAYWAARRPQYTAGDDWIAGILKPETDGA